MYKYESYIKEFLLQNGEIGLEQIGFFTLTKEPFQTDGGTAPVLQKIFFQYSRKSLTTVGLIHLIADKEQKNKQIAKVDFESYLNEMRQLLNTGKEVLIDGFGHLFLNKRGEYEFVQQVSLPGKKEENIRRRTQQKDAERIKKISGVTRNNRQAITFFSIFFIVLFLASLGWGIYSLTYKKNEEAGVSETAEINLDTIRGQKTIVPVIDSSKKSVPADSLSNTDSGFYKFIFESTVDRMRAYNRVEKLKDYGDPAALDSERINDTTILYHLFLLKKTTPADTLSMKDTLQKYFQRDITIKLASK